MSSIIQSNIAPNDLLQQSEVVGLSNIDTQGQTNKLIYLNENSQYVLKNPDEVIDIGPTNITPGADYETLQTINGATGWAKIGANNINNLGVTDSKILSVSANKISGQISDAQISDLSASKITGTVSENQMANNSVSEQKL